jgi:hypothetical protein
MLNFAAESKNHFKKVGILYYFGGFILKTKYFKLFVKHYN